MMSSSTDKWRSYGRIRRQWLLQNDSQQAFRINASCSMDKYVSLANKLLTQFRNTMTNSDSKETAYVLGRRLLLFCRDALPLHPDFTASPIDKTWLQEQLEELALAIDEEQLNLYMDGEMDPEIQDDEEEWESFDGWNSVPQGTETDDSSNDYSEDLLQHSPVMVSQVPPLEESYDDPEFEESYDEPEASYDDPDLIMYNEDDDDNEDMVRRSCFLKKIARQSVEFESDSEAADSWAQDPADRFEQELHRHSKTLQALQRQLEMLQADAPVALV